MIVDQFQPFGEAEGWIDESVEGRFADRMVLLFGPERAQEAAQLAVRARHAGTRVRLLGRGGPDGRPQGARILRALTELREPDEPPAGGRELALFLADRPVDVSALGIGAQVAVAQLPSGRAEHTDPAAAMLPAPGGPVLVRTGGDARLELRLGAVAPAPTPALLRVWGVPAVETHVSAAEGEFVADVHVGVNRRVRLGTSAGERPVRISLSGGRVQRLSCPEPDLCAFLERAVTVHRLDRLLTVRFAPADPRGPVLLRLGVADAEAASPASADLRVDLGGAAAWTVLPADGTAAVLAAPNPKPIQDPEERR